MTARKQAEIDQGIFMTGEFDNLPPPPIGSPEHQLQRYSKVKAWMHELDVKIARLDKALAEMLSPAPSTDHAQAKKRVEHEMNQLKSRIKAMRNGLEGI
jgi:hypothetical protein